MNGHSIAIIYYYFSIKKRYRIGDIFTSLQPSKAKERMNIEKESISKDIKGLKQSMEGMEKEMNQLKNVLYGKFGQSINLERA